MLTNIIHMVVAKGLLWRRQTVSLLYKHDSAKAESPERRLRRLRDFFALSCL